jgi:hypothetical protein
VKGKRNGLNVVKGRKMGRKTGKAMIVWGNGRA